MTTRIHLQGQDCVLHCSWIMPEIPLHQEKLTGWLLTKQERLHVSDPVPQDLLQTLIFFHGPQLPMSEIG